MNKVIMVLVLVGACSWRENARTLEAYEQEAERCSQNIEAIVAREGTTRDQDLSDLDVEERRCFDTLEQILGGGDE